MIRTTLTASFPGRPNMAAVTRVTAQQAVSAPRSQQAFARAIAEPPKSLKKAPMAKMTPKQRGFVFANIKLPHQRTGGVTDKWKLLVIDAGDGATVVLRNTSRAAKFVHGTATGRFQQKFLRDNAWKPTPEIRALTFSVVLEELRLRFAPALRNELATTVRLR